MPQFIDIGQYTETTPTGEEYIQISANFKAKLKDIAKLAAPDNVPTDEGMSEAITNALSTFKETEIDPINEELENLTPVENNFVTNATTAVTVAAGDIVNCTSTATSTTITVSINRTTFTSKSNTALVIARGNKTVQFTVTGATGTVYKAEFPTTSQENETARIAYAIQLVDPTNNLFLVNACLYKS